MKCCFCAGASSNKVYPVPGLHDSYDYIEARPRRYLRVSHSNFSPQPDVVKLHPSQQSNREVETGSQEVAAAEEEEEERKDGGREKRPREVAEHWVSRRSDYSAPSLKRGGVSLAPTDWILFFVHGVGGSSQDWNHQIEYFKCLNYRTVAVDLIGHGLSSQPDRAEDYSFRQLAADFLALFDQYADCKGNVLIGHSLGCSICTYVAAKRPYAVSKLVLISGGGPDLLTSSSPSCCCGCCCCCCCDCDILSLPNCLFYLFKPCCYSYVKKLLFSQDHLKSTDNLRTSLDDISPDVVKYTLKGQEWPEGNEMFHKNLKIDCQLICGTEDSLVDEDDEIRMFHALRFCRLDLVVDGSHMVMIERPILINDVINEFLNQPIPLATDFTDFHISGMLQPPANSEGDGSAHQSDDVIDQGSLPGSSCPENCGGSGPAVVAMQPTPKQVFTNTSKCVFYHKTP